MWYLCSVAGFLGMHLVFCILLIPPLRFSERASVLKSKTGTRMAYADTAGHCSISFIASQL